MFKFKLGESGEVLYLIRPSVAGLLNIKRGAAPRDRRKSYVALALLVERRAEYCVSAGTLAYELYQLCLFVIYSC